MSVITVSRGTLSGGREFAVKLAQKLGYRCVSREELSEEAVKQGIPVGKLQTAMVRPPRVHQRMGHEREHYISFLTATLCKYALEGNLVYHGHTGHLLLPGIPNIFRVRVLAAMNHRIETVMSRLKLSHEKAVEYIRNVDRDRDRWVRFLYGVSWDEPSGYDLVINLDQVGVENATTALCAMVELPDFTMPPATFKALHNLYLANAAHLRLAQDKRTRNADFKVTANNGVVQVTCLPQQADVGPYVPDIVADLEGCREVRCTVASTNILWLGERFEIGSELFGNLVKVARKWDAAVELLCLTKEQEEAQQAAGGSDGGMDEYTGGIEDDLQETPAGGNPEANAALDALQREGCAGGMSTVYGDQESMIKALGHRKNYRLVVVGDVFVDRPHAVRTRMMQELINLFMDNFKAPVVGADELQREVKFGLREFIRLGLLFAAALAMFILVIGNQETVLNLLAGEGLKAWRPLVIFGVLVIVPLFAYSYGSTTKQLLKFFSID